MSKYSTYASVQAKIMYRVSAALKSRAVFGIIKNRNKIQFLQTFQSGGNSQIMMYTFRNIFHEPPKKNTATIALHCWII